MLLEAFNYSLISQPPWEILGLHIRAETNFLQTTLIVGPVALVRQWEREIKHKINGSHRLSSYLVHGQQKKLSWDDLRNYDVVLTTCTYTLRDFYSRTPFPYLRSFSKFTAFLNVSRLLSRSKRVVKLAKRLDISNQAVLTLIIYRRDLSSRSQAIGKIPREREKGRKTRHRSEPHEKALPSPRAEEFVLPGLPR
jgi:hypothetical protein